MIRAMRRHHTFLAAFFTGAPLIVLLRELAPGLVGAFMAALGCVAIIIAFAVHQLKQSRAAAFRAADDFYYLGLLFTLVSLIHVLVRVFAIGDGGGGERTQQLIGNFGIALISTVAGILVRVFLLGLDHQATPEGSTRGASSPADPYSPADPFPAADPFSPADPSAPPSQPDDALPEAGPTPTSAGRGAAVPEPDDLVAMRDQVRQARDALSHFTRVTLAQAEQTKAHTERLMSEFNERSHTMASDRQRGLDDVVTSWEIGTQRMRDETESLIQEADRRLAEAVERADAAWRQSAGHAEQAADAIRQRTDAASEQFASLAGKVNALRDVFEPLITDMTAASRSMSALDHATGATSSRLQNMTDDLAAATARIDTAGQAVADQLGELHATLASAGQAAAPLGDLLAAANRGVGTLGEATAGIETRLTGAGARIERGLVESADHLSATIASIAATGEAFDASRAAIAATGRTFDASRESITDLADRIDRLAGAATDAATGLDARADEIVAAHNALAEGARQFQERTLAAYETTVGDLADVTRRRQQDLRREVDAWSSALDSLADLLRRQQELAERNTAGTAGSTHKPERGPRFLGIGTRR